MAVLRDLDLSVIVVVEPERAGDPGEPGVRCASVSSCETCRWTPGASVVAISSSSRRGR